jgi:hypothetical protein
LNVPAYAKTLVAVVGAVAAAASVAISDSVITPAEWVTIVLAALTALGVWAIPNKDA